MKNYQLVLARAAMLLSVAFCHDALAAEARNLVAQTPYPAEYISNYMKECVQRAIAEGLPEPEAQTVCNCTIASFQAQYTLDEFEALTKAANSNPEAAEALNEVGATCFEEVLYEN